MSPPAHPVFEPVVARLLAQRTASAPDSLHVAIAAQALYDELARVCAPLIGRQGFDALARRAIHLTRLEQPRLCEDADVGATGETFRDVISCLERQSPGIAATTAVAVLSGMTVLLITFIGESLTAGVLRRAWPEGFAELSTEET
jgi:hypothetical protein